jgi:transcriptional regulator with XRE-family HTH domain
MRKKKVNIQETFAKNLRENRRKSGFTQVQLAEKADISTNYLAMVEIARYIPRVEIIERLANALNVEIYELFIVPPSHERVIEQLQQVILDNLDSAMEHALDKAIEKRCGDISFTLPKKRK